MEQKKTAADQVRPFLAALDRSIDSARRRRLKSDDQAGEPSSNPEFGARTPTPEGATPASTTPDPTDTILGGGPAANGARNPDDPPRFKARPKRSASFGSSNGPSQNYRPQAG